MHNQLIRPRFKLPQDDPTAILEFLTVITNDGAPWVPIFPEEAQTLIDYFAKVAGDKKDSDLTMLVACLVRALKKTQPDHHLVQRVTDYMKRMGHWKASDCLRSDKGGIESEL